MRFLVCLSLLAGLIPGGPALGQRPVTGAAVPCEGGQAAGYPCRSVDLLSFLPITRLGGGPQTRLNDIWGWTDPETGREYALVGRTDGTAFVDVTDPVRPVYLGSLPLTQLARPTPWRDVKVYADHAFIVADAAGTHGMQVFDLRRLRDVAAPPVVFDETNLYFGFEEAHNIAINEATGYAYATGFRRGQPVPCGPGLHIVDVRNPAEPVYAGCFSDATAGYSGPGYTHDAQCVVYHGPDADYRGREVCVAANEVAISIADVTDKASPTSISVATYPDARYVHQGWLTEDHRYFFQDDETDEVDGVVSRTRTLVWDLADLDQPVLLATYLGTTGTTDHNQYVVGHLVYQANYKSGLRILDIRDVARPVEVGYFDTYLISDDTGYEGAWSNYPFFESGIVVVSSTTEGLFVLRPDEALQPTGAEGPGDVPAAFALGAPYPNPSGAAPAAVALTLDAPQPVRLSLHNVLGQEVAVLHDGLLAAGAHRFTVDPAGLPAGAYLLRARGARTTRTRLLTLVK